MEHVTHQDTNKNRVKSHAQPLDFFNLFLEFINIKHTIPENDPFWLHISNTNIASIPTSVLDIFIYKTLPIYIKNSIKNNNIVHYFIFIRNLINKFKQFISTNEFDITFNQFHSVLLLTRTCLYILSLHLSVIELIFYLDYSKYYDKNTFSNNNGLEIKFISESISIDSEITSDSDLFNLIVNNTKLSTKTTELLSKGFCFLDSEYRIHSIKNVNKLISDRRDLTLVLIPFTLHSNSLIKSLLNDILEFIKLDVNSINMIKSKNFMLEIFAILSSLILKSSFTDTGDPSIGSEKIRLYHPYSGTGLLYYDHIISRHEGENYGNNITHLLHRSNEPDFIIQRQLNNMDFGFLFDQFSMYCIDCKNPIITEYCKLLLFILIIYSYKSNITFTDSDFTILFIIKLIQEGKNSMKVEFVPHLFNYLDQLLMKSQCNCWVVIDSAIATLVILNEVSFETLNIEIEYYLDIILNWMIFNLQNIFNIDLQVHLSSLYLKLINFYSLNAKSTNRFVHKWFKLFTIYNELTLNLENAVYNLEYDLILGWICSVFSTHIIAYHISIHIGKSDKNMVRVLKLMDKIAQHDEYIDIPEELDVLVDIDIIKSLYGQLNIICNNNKVDDIIDYSNLLISNVEYFKPLLWSTFRSLLTSKDAYLALKYN